MTAVRRIRHLALDPVADRRGVSGLDESGRNDCQRTALLLQGAALLAHLRLAGWRLRSWRGAVVDPRGVLRVELGAVTAGPEKQSPQAALRPLAAALFGSEDMPGRSAGRASLRPVVAGWHEPLLPMPANRLVADVLDHAPFLWGDEYRVARLSLLAVHEREEGDELVVAGHSRWRRSLLREAGGDAERLATLLGSGAARDHWLGDDVSGGPADWIARGDWRRAVDESLRAPPVEPKERSEVARALLDRGRFEAALTLVGSSCQTDDMLIRLKGQVRTGRIAAARRTLSALGKCCLEDEARLEQCEEAIRIHAVAGRPGQLRAWAERAREAAVGPLAGRGRALAVLALRELGAGGDMASLLDAGEEPEDWLSCLARARLEGDGGGFAEADRTLTAALARFRRRLPIYDRASLWNELAEVRLAADDCLGAERAARASVRLFRCCEGAAGRFLGHGLLAEVRIRTGRLGGVRETIDGLRKESLMAGSAAGIVDAQQLQAGLDLAQGRWGSALECSRSAMAELRKRQGRSTRLRRLRLLSGRALVHLGRRQEAREELQAALPLANRLPGEGVGSDAPPGVFFLAGLREEARFVGVRDGCGGLWEAISEDRPPSGADWRLLEEQGAFRCALTIHDLVCLGIETVPSGLLASAVRTLSELGAEAPAQRVDGARWGPWRALRTFLGVDDLDSESFRSLFSSAGHPEARIAVHASRGAGEPDLGAEILLEGPGGSEQFSVGVPGGRLVLSADGIEEPERALLAVIADRVSVTARRRIQVLELAEARKPAAYGMVGRSAALLEAQGRVEKLALHNLPVLIQGESGTGKELLARQLHRSSARASRAWLAVNCAALPEGLLMSDLFGHMRGSFTGADHDRVGVFESAEGGTVFLDEVAELPLAAQGMLLRLLQEGEIRRIGESHPRRLDFRLVSATHRDLPAMVAAGDFREDLYYRLRVATVKAPALRDRGDDVILLAHHFLRAFGRGGDELRFSGSARARILDYPWPGNVRELRNAVEGAVALADGAEIEVEMLGLPKEPAPHPRGGEASYHRKIEQYRRVLIRNALADADGNQARAARSLGLSRQALSYLVRKSNYDP